jgi:formylmethanofuran dehydrogenase subunit E
MIKYRIKVLIRGSITYKNERIEHTKIVDEYDMDLVRMAEEKLIKVTKVEVEAPKKDSKSKSKKIDKLDN